MDESALLAEVNTWVGVSIALIGAVVVSPSGARLLLSSTISWSDSQIRRVRRWLRLAGRTSAVRGGRSAVSASMKIGFSVEASGRAWPSTGTVDEKIDTLRRYLTELETNVKEDRRETRRHIDAVRQQVGRVEEDVRQKLQAMRRLVDERSDESARIDARGLPVVGWGILLSGAPEQLAAIPGHLGWLFPASGVVAAATAVVHAVRQRRAVTSKPSR